MTTKSQAEQFAAEGFPGDPGYEEAHYANADSLLGPVVPSVTWPEIGSSVTGTVMDVSVNVQTNMDGEILTFPDGSPRQQIIVTLQTEDSEDDDDDGRRRLFVKGQMMQALRAVCRQLKVPGLRAGGLLSVTYESDGKPARKGLSAPKQFAVRYVPPAGN